LEYKSALQIPELNRDLVPALKATCSATTLALPHVNNILAYAGFFPTVEKIKKRLEHKKNHSRSFHTQNRKQP